MWVSERVCPDSREYFDLVCEAVANARRSVVLEMYIFRLDSLGLRLLRAIKAAAARGVAVRMIVDGFGSPEFNRDLVSRLKNERVQARVYHPTPGVLDFLGSPSLRRFSRVLSNINKRNHRKMIVVDNDVAFVGSCNVSDSHNGWRETAVCLRGGGVASLVNSFELIWSRAGYSGLSGAQRLKSRLRSRRAVGTGGGEVADSGSVRSNITLGLRSQSNSQLAALIEKSTKRVWITTAYFVPSPVIVAALLRATRNGSDVRLLLPGVSDVTIVSYVSRMFYRGLMMAGVQIYEYQPSVLHAKTLIIDDWVSVGTTNINHRSFYHDLEVDVTLYEPESRDSLVQQFEEDLLSSNLITFDRLTRRSWFEKAGGYLIYPFRRFI